MIIYNHTNITYTQNLDDGSFERISLDGEGEGVLCGVLDGEGKMGYHYGVLKFLQKDNLIRVRAVRKKGF
jgi:hypothetical protein